MTPVLNNSYLVVDANGIIDSELHCIGANGSGMWYFANKSSINNEVFTTTTEYGSAKLFQSTEEVPFSGIGASGSGFDDMDNFTVAMKALFTDPSLEGYYECHAMDENETMGVIRVGMFINGRG